MNESIYWGRTFGVLTVITTVAIFVAQIGVQGYSATEGAIINSLGVAGFINTWAANLIALAIYGE